MALDEDRTDAVAGEADAGHEASRASAHDQTQERSPPRRRILVSMVCMLVAPYSAGHRVRLVDTLSDEVGLSDMDKRQYVQRVRADAADATRRRILDAARATLERGPSKALRVEEVADDGAAYRARRSTCCTAPGPASSTRWPGTSAWRPGSTS